METTKLSNKGQIALPRAIRTATRMEDVAGCAGYRRPRKSVEQMDAAVAAMARRHK